MGGFSQPVKEARRPSQAEAAFRTDQFASETTWPGLTADFILEVRTMAKQARAMSADQVSEKTLELTQTFGRYVYDHPDFLEKLPDRATLVFLDPDDPWFNEEARRNAERNQR
jgi:hypothetical protein